MVFQSELVCACTFRCPPNHPLFADSGPSGVPTFVFPRTHTEIRHAGREAFLGGPDRVSFYNAGQEYRRSKASPEGDRSDWYVVAPEALTEIVAGYDKRAGERPFAFPYGPCDLETYALQRRAFLSTDALFIEETILDVLDRVIAASYRAWDTTRRPRLSAHRDLAEHARSIVARRFCDAMSLAEIAREAGSSPYHLCRVFRSQTGMSIHRYREQLRMRAALERVNEDLTSVALDLGYSSHSHFTLAFRKAFGMPPARWRYFTARRRYSNDAARPT